MRHSAVVMRTLIDARTALDVLARECRGRKSDSTTTIT